MENMYAIFAPDKVEHSERNAAIGNPDLPDTSTDNRHWPAVQRPLSELKQVQLTAECPAHYFRKSPNDVPCIAVPVDTFQPASNHRKLYRKRYIIQRRSWTEQAAKFDRFKPFSRYIHQRNLGSAKDGQI